MKDDLFHYQYCKVLAGFEGCNIAYVDIGPNNAEEVILCLHGINRNSRDFDYLAKHFVINNKCRILLPDMVGRGKSSWLVNKSDYTYETYISTLRQLLSKLNIEKVSIFE